jgi:hypothetical protein
MRYNTVENSHAVSIFWLRKHGHIEPRLQWTRGSLKWLRNGVETGSIGFEIEIKKLQAYAEVGEIRLKYVNTNNITGEVSEMDYMVPITTTICNYGGIRFWFRCPLSNEGVYCRRRVGVLYKVSKWFGCRYCAGLVYADQNESKRFRGIVSELEMERAYNKIQRFNYKGKPTKKYLRYLKLKDKYDQQWLDWADLIASNL